MDAPAPSVARAARRLRLRVRGAVQGVGFRPFAYGLAARLRARAASCCNDGEGVLIEIEGRRAQALSADAAPRRRRRSPASIRSMSTRSRRWAARASQSSASSPRPGLDPHRRGRSDLRGLPRRAVRSGKPLLRLPADQLHPLWAALYADAGPALRPGADLDGALPDVRGVRARLRGSGEPPFPRRADRLPALRAEAQQACQRGRRRLAQRENRRAQGARRLSSPV